MDAKTNLNMRCLKITNLPPGLQYGGNGYGDEKGVLRTGRHYAETCFESI